MLACGCKIDKRQIVAVRQRNGDDGITPDERRMVGAGCRNRLICFGAYRKRRIGRNAAPTVQGVDNVALGNGKIRVAVFRVGVRKYFLP